MGGSWGHHQEAGHIGLEGRAEAQPLQQSESELPYLVTCSFCELHEDRDAVCWFTAASYVYNSTQNTEDTQ